ncbi:endonuclease/exonuclease/phosphatase family protein [uncultured Pseudoalteromonas sp.]|uniref:endonuclease/exonuclease/phosphatase family protein n=1 Tax=uncultured Pseudoalteromonas sp. TaxID=114053 RepID=UPI0030C7AC75
MATFNLFNYLEPPNAYYDFEKIYTAEQWGRKQRWIVDYLNEYAPDVVGFQEVFSIESLKALMALQGYAHFAVVDTPEVVDDFIFKRPVVAIASKFEIVEVAAVKHSNALASELGLCSDFTFSRKVLRATISLPHVGNTDCYVVHFKSKRPLLEPDENTKSLATTDNELSPEKSIIEAFKANVAGSWGSTIQRGSEATLLMIEMIARREDTQYPMVLMGDFNNDLADGVLSHLLTKTLRFAPAFDVKAYLAKYCLNDAWQLFKTLKMSELTAGNSQQNADSHKDEPQNIAPVASSLIPSDSVSQINAAPLLTRKPTHYFGASSSVLDYILLSCEFDPSYDDSFYEVSDYHTYDRHLINPEYERDDLTTDHAVVSITLTLRS